MASSSDAAIDLTNVTKVYGRRVHALQGISLNIQRGEVFGLLGPNGRRQKHAHQNHDDRGEADHRTGNNPGQTRWR